MIGAGGLLYCLDEGLKVPEDIGLAGFNGVELIDGLPKRLATMDSCRLQIGATAAEIVAGATVGNSSEHPRRVELEPVFATGDTVRSN